MKTKITFLFFILVCLLPAISIIAQQKDSLVLINSNSASWYAILNKANKTIRFLNYESAKDSVHDGLYPVCLHHKYGYLDNTGKEIISCKYDYGESFVHGFAVVGVQDSTLEDETDFFGNHYKSYVYHLHKGIINRNGQIILPLKYDEVKPFSDGLAYVHNTKQAPFYVDTTGQVKIILHNCESANSFINGFTVFCKDSKKKKFAQEAPVDIPQKEGKEKNTAKPRVVISIADDDYFNHPNISLYGVMDKEKKEVIPAQFTSLREFKDGRAAVQKEWQGKYGFIDRSGKQVVPCIYDQVSDFTNGLAIVTVTDTERTIEVGPYHEKRYAKRQGVIDKNGHYILPLKYSQTKFLGKNLIAVGSYLFDRKGNKITNHPYEFTVLDNGIVVFWKKDGKKLGLMNQNGKIVTPPILTGLNSTVSDGMIKIEKQRNTKAYWVDYGFANDKGEMVIKPVYYEADLFSEGLAKIKMSYRKVGFIDKTGAQIIDTVYTRAGKFSEGLAWVSNEKRQVGFINKRNQFIIPAKYIRATQFTNGFAIVWKTDIDKASLVDKVGNEYNIIPAETKNGSYPKFYQ